MDSKGKTARLWQPLLCWGLLASMALSVTGLEALLHSERLGVWMDEAWASVNDTANEYSRQYRDTEDRIMLQDLPDLDPSSGGVYFFGASNMKWAMRVPDLPPAQRRLVHDFGAGEGVPYFHLQFTKYLVDDKNILRAGPDKTLIVYGACFINAQAFRRDDPGAVFPHMWERYGLFRYDPTAGIEPVADGSPWARYALEKARASSFIHGLIDRAGRLAVPKSLRRRDTTHDAAVYAADYKARMGPHWHEGIAESRSELQEWYDYVHARRMHFMIVMLPLASWHRPLPYPKEYRAMIQKFCVENRVPLVDLSGILKDGDFLDHIHANAGGLKKTDAALMAVARNFLKDKGVWPAEQTALAR